MKFRLFALMLPFVLGTQFGLADPAPTPLPVTMDSWKNALPFSFTYGGKDSAQLLAAWPNRAEEQPSPGGMLHRYIFTDPETHLVVTATLRTFDKFDAYDWVLTFRNDGTADTPIIENILPLNWRVAAADGAAVVHHARGSNASANDFEPLDEVFGPGGSTHLESANGRSSDTNTLPFFNFQTGDHGLIGGIGWTGDWKADFAYDAASKSVTLSAGMKQTHLLLHPGEEIRTPRIVLQNWKGGDWQAAQNGWRRLIFAYYSPQEDGKPLVGPVQVAAWSGEPIQKKLDMINWIHGHGIDVDLYGTDAEWYGNYSQPSPRGPDAWWRERGDWFPDPVNYPHGLRPLGDLLKADKIKFMLWFEPETAMPNTMIVKAHPDWFLQSDPPGANGGALLLNLGKPEALAGITKLISGFLTDFGLTWYREDFNINPSIYWHHNDAPDRIGMTEIQHIQNLYKFWNALFAQHPGLQFDNCASGGRREDMESISRSLLSTRTDYTGNDMIAMQACTQGLADWVPINFGTAAYTFSSPWNTPPPYGTPANIYAMRLAYTTAITLAVGAPGVNNDAWVAWIKQALAEFREVRPYWYGDFYALLPWNLQNDTWTAWQLDSPEERKGLVEVLRRPASPYTAVRLALHGIDPAARYSVEFRTGYEHVAPRDMNGADLAHLDVSVPDAPGSVLVFYRKK